MTRLVLSLSLVLVVGACGSSRDMSKPRSTSTTVHVAPASGLRGSAVRTFECPARPVSPVARPTRIGTPQALLLCPLALPDQASSAIMISAGRPEFAALLAALSRPDEPKTSAVCPLYADMLQVVLAKTGAHSYQVSLPVDGCGHYQRPVLDALNHARGN